LFAGEDRVYRRVDETLGRRVIEDRAVEDHDGVGFLGYVEAFDGLCGTRFVGERSYTSRNTDEYTRQAL